MSKVLVVVDMQNDFIDGALGTDEAVKIVDNVCRKIKDFDGDIVITLDSHKEDYLETLEGKNLPVPHCIQQTHGWKLNSKVKEALDSTGRIYDVFVKTDSFGSVELGQHLEEKGYDSIELIGLCTDICVISNALTIKSFCNNTPISVDSSCCAGVTPQSHENALSAMKTCQIKII